MVIGHYHLVSNKFGFLVGLTVFCLAKTFHRSGGSHWSINVKVDLCVCPTASRTDSLSVSRNPNIHCLLGLLDAPGPITRSKLAK